MYQLILIIPTSVDLFKFDKGWPLFLDAVEDMPGLISESFTRIDRHIYGQSTISMIYLKGKLFYYPESCGKIQYII